MHRLLPERLLQRFDTAPAAVRAGAALGRFLNPGCVVTGGQTGVFHSGSQFGRRGRGETGKAVETGRGPDPPAAPPEPAAR